MPSKNKKKNNKNGAVTAPAPTAKKVETQQNKPSAIVDNALLPPPGSASTSSDSSTPRKPIVKKIEPPPLSPGKSGDCAPSKESMDMFDPQASKEIGTDSTVLPPPPVVDVSETDEQDQAAMDRIKLEESIAIGDENARKDEEMEQKLPEEDQQKKMAAAIAEKKRERELAEKEKKRITKEAVDRAKAAEAFAEKTGREADEAEAKLKEEQDKLQSRLKEKEEKTLADRVAAAAAAGKNKAQAAIAKAKEAAQKLKDPKKDPRIGGGSANATTTSSSGASAMTGSISTSTTSSATLVTPDKRTVSDSNGIIAVGSIVTTPYGIGKVIDNREDGMSVIKPSSWKLANNCTPTIYMMKKPPLHTPTFVEIGVGTPADMPIRTAASTPESPGNKNCICF